MNRERASGSYVFYLFLIVDEVFDKLLFTFNIKSTLKDARGITKVRYISHLQSGDVPLFAKDSQAGRAQGSASAKQRRGNQGKDYKSQAV